MKKRFLALACAVLTAVLFSSCDTGNGGGGLTDEDPFLPAGGTNVPAATGETLTVAGIAAENDYSNGALQLVKETSSNVQVSAGDTVKISFVITGAGNFKQIGVMSALDGYSAFQDGNLWYEEGLPDGTEYSCTFENADHNFESVNWQVIFPNPIEEGKTESIVLSDIKVEVL